MRHGMIPRRTPLVGRTAHDGSQKEGQDDEKERARTGRVMRRSTIPMSECDMKPQHTGRSIRCRKI